MKKREFSLLLVLVMITAVLCACGKKEVIDPGLLKPFVGEWHCENAALEHESYYTGYLAMNIQEDGTFRMYDVEAGNPVISGDLKIVSDSELVLVCNTDEDFDPPVTWEDMSEEQTISYKFVSEKELHMTFENDGNPSTLVFAVEGEDADVDAETFAFMEDKVPEGEAGNVFYVPNAAVEAMSNSEVYLFNNGLLLTEVIMDEETSDILLKLISLEDGSLKAENRFPASGDAMVQFGEEYMILHDCAMGSIQMLDQDLQVVNGWELDYMYDCWFLSQDIETVYMFSYEGIIVAKNLVSGEEETLVEGLADMWVVEHQDYAVIFAYTNGETGETEYMALDLTDGSMRVIEGGDYMFVAQGVSGTAQCDGGSLRVLRSKQKLIHVNDENNKLALYELNGEHVSTASLSADASHYVSKKIVWSGYWNGFFFTDTTETGSRLMFWDPEVPTEGENLTVNLVETANDPT